MDDLDLVTLHGRRMTALHRQEADGIMYRSRMRTLHALCSAQDEIARLLRANRQLQDENARAVEVIRELADRSEAFRRLVVHLRDAWDPADPSDLPLKVSLKPLLEQKKLEVANDACWANERDADLTQRFSSLTGPGARKR